MDTDNLNTLKDYEGVALVEFFASWCPHCKRMAPVVDDIEALMEGRARVFRFDIDEYGELASELDVKSIPTFIIFKNGEEMWRASGEMDGSAIASRLESLL